MDVVAQVLEKTAKESEKFKPITVAKHLELEIDTGTLLACDKNDLDVKALKTKKDSYLLNLARDNAQLLFNKIWELPTKRVDESIVAVLPPCTFMLPRSRPVPKAKTPTKWQQFALDKGITKKKKSKLSWDEQLQKWVPLYGYKRAAAQKDKDWVIEVPANADPMEDQFEKKAHIKSERVAKNEFQRLRNIAKARNVKIPRIGITEVNNASAKDLSTAVTVAKASTASIGKFQPKLPKEKEARGVAAITPGTSKKRKMPPVPGKVEKSENLTVIDSILNKQPKIDIEQAVSQHLHDEKAQRSEDNRTGKSKGGRGGKKGKSGGKKGNSGGPKGITGASKGTSGGPKSRGIAKKPVAGKGNRNPNKRTLGRKRR